MQRLTFSLVSFVLLFILKLKFPKYKSFTEILSRKYGLDTIKIYRRLEKTYFRLNKVQLDIDFLQSCKENRIIPKFLKFKTYNRKMTQTNLYSSFQFKLLNLEIVDKNKSLRQLNSEFLNLKHKLQDILSWIDFKCLFNRLISSNQAKLKTVKDTHTKKLLHLGISPHHNVDKEKVVINLSKRKLTNDEKDVLSLGLSFALPKLKIDFVQLF